MSQFLNVDLEIESVEDLAGIAAALEATGKIFCLHLGPTEAGHLGAFQLTSLRQCDTPDRAIRSLVKVVRTLPASMRRTMRRGRLDLSVGIQAGAEPRSLELPLSPTALRTAASIGARITVCVYADDAQIPFAAAQAIHPSPSSNR